MKDELDEIFRKHISRNLYPDDLIQFYYALNKWKDNAVLKARIDELENIDERGGIALRLAELTDNKEVESE